jgi:hypothetical protein
MAHGSSDGVSQHETAAKREEITSDLTAGLEMLQRAHALNPLKLNTLESLKIAYEFVKQPDQVKATEDKIKALRLRYPNLPNTPEEVGVRGYQ